MYPDKQRKLYKIFAQITDKISNVGNMQGRKRENDTKEREGDKGQVGHDTCRFSGCGDAGNPAGVTVEGESYESHVFSIGRSLRQKDIRGEEAGLGGRETGILDVSSFGFWQSEKERRGDFGCIFIQAGFF